MYINIIFSFRYLPILDVLFFHSPFLQNDMTHFYNCVLFHGFSRGGLMIAADIYLVISP